MAEGVGRSGPGSIVWVLREFGAAVTVSIVVIPRA